MATTAASPSAKAFKEDFAAVLLPQSPVEKMLFLQEESQCVIQLKALSIRE